MKTDNKNFWRGFNELNNTEEFEKSKNFEFTDEIYEEKEKQNLENIKKQKISQIDKKVNDMIS